MLTPAEVELTASRTNIVDYARLETLHYLGNYVRRLPVSMTRMIENAHDWEHLPHVHASSFSSIGLIDSGPWGWRAKIGIPESSGGGHMLLDLLVDGSKNYWASTVFSGPGEGAEIHTQATEISSGEIEVDVRFFFAEKPADQGTADFMLQYLQEQYRQLYDEDLALMSGRQSALDDRARWREAEQVRDAVMVGSLNELDPTTTHIVELATGRFCIRRLSDEWIVHSATCPHLLGPLGDGSIDQEGNVTCPWHGYSFNVETGKNLQNKCKALVPAPRLDERDGTLYLIPEP